MPHPTLNTGLAQPGARIATRPVLGHLICLCLASFGGLAQAGAAPADSLPMNTPPDAAATPVTGTAADQVARPDPAPLRLALDSPAASTNPATAGARTTAPFKPPWLTGSDVHKVLGLGTLLAVGLTAATAPGDGENKNTASTAPRQTSGTTHTRSARTAAVLAGATVASGLLVHWDDFSVKDGIRDPDNQHVLLGLVGAGLMLYAVNKSMKSAVPTQHAVYGELGGAAMAVAVKLTW